MHIFFSGIGGTGIGPLALIAKQAGYQVSGSDEKDSQYIHYLKEHGVSGIHIGQTANQIAAVHSREPIDWFVHTSALTDQHPELAFCNQHGIKIAKQYEFLNKILSNSDQKLIAIAGTHGKTTTTAMAIWLFKQLNNPISYSVGAKVSFGDMGNFEPQGRYFVAESDEFDRKFLVLKPRLAIITGLAWDHHEIYPTQEEYNNAFRKFLNQSQQQVLWQEDADQLGIQPGGKALILSEADSQIDKIKLAGLYNRRDAFLVAHAVHQLTREPLVKLLDLLSKFPGVSRRFEKITDNLYSDYAHTPEKIRGVMNVALETTHPTGQKIVVVYEPLTNRRMHYTRDAHHGVFDGASKIYWVPSYLAREDPDQPVLEPSELIESLSSQLQTIAQPAELDNKLKESIDKHLASGDLVLALSGGGGNSLDEWLRKEIGSQRPSVESLRAAESKS